MSKTRLNQIFPADLVADFGVDGFRYHFLRDTPFGPDGDFSYEAMVSRYNSDLANNLGNLLSRVATVVGQEVRGRRPRPLARTRRWPRSRPSAYAATAAGWEAIAPSQALEATWRLVREANAHLEAHEPWKMEPGPELDAVMGDALEVLRIVSVLASPAMPRDLRRGLVAHRPGRGARRRSASPTRRRGAGTPAGLAVTKGDPLFPRMKAPTAADVARRCAGPTTTATSARRPRRRRPGRRRGGRRRGPRRRGRAPGRTWAPTWPRSQSPRSRRPRALDGVWATAGVHPHDAEGGLDGLEALLGRPEVVAVGECGLDFHYDHSPRDVQREVFAAQVAPGPRPPALPLVVHTREAWDETFAVLEGEGVPERTVIHCFTGGPDEARRCLDLGAHLSFSGIVTFKGAPEVREAAALCPLDRLLVETDAPYLAPVPHRGRPNRPGASSRWSARPWPTAKGCERGRDRRGDLGQRRGLYRLRAGTEPRRRPDGLRRRPST